MINLSWLDEAKLLSDLSKRLREKGFDALLLDRHSQEAIGGGTIRWLSAAYDINESPIYVGSLKITKNRFDQVQIFSRMVPSDVGAFRWYDVHFCVLGDVKERVNDLTASMGGNLDVIGRIKKVFSFDKKVDESVWVGGALADRLNEDTELKNLLREYGLWRFRGDLHPTSNVRVRPDKKYACVRIIFRMDRKTSNDVSLLTSKTVESLEIASRISRQIHFLIDNSD